MSQMSWQASPRRGGRTNVQCTINGAEHTAGSRRWLLAFLGRPIRLRHHGTVREGRGLRFLRIAFGSEFAIVRRSF